MKKMLLSLIALLCIAGSAYAVPDPVAHWPLDGDASDISGNGYGGTLNGTYTFVEGPYGDALDTTAASGWVNIPVAAWNDNIVNGYTVCYWSFTGTIHASVPFRVTAGNDRKFSCHVPWSDGLIYFDAASSTANYQRISIGGTSAQWLSLWSHWAFVYTPGQQQIYLNGTLLHSGTGTQPVEVGATAFSFSGESDGVANNFQGIMDDVRLYNTVLTAEEIQEVMAGAGLASFGAHTPVPASGSTVISNDVPTTTSVSWYSPLQDSDGIDVVDSNILSVTGYDVYWSETEPNYFIAEPVSVNQPGKSYTPATAITYDKTYYWRVDAHVTWDSNEITGNWTDTVEGKGWQFTTEPSYTPPIIATFANVRTAMDLPSAVLSATVAGNSHPMNAPVFTLLTDDIEFPYDPNITNTATLTNITGGVDNENPTATLANVNLAGAYKVKLAVSDGATTVEKIAQVIVYADDCQAKKDAGGWVANYYDRNSDCYVALSDFALLATDWLNDTTLAAQASYTSAAGFVPLDVYNVREEAEWIPFDDPNACSNGPINDTSGIQIATNAAASNGEHLGNNGTGSWVDYTIDVPTAAVNNAVDVYVGYGLNLATTPQTISFGTAANPTLYGEGTVLYTGGWYNFVGVNVCKVTFTTAGSQKVRITMGVGGLNLDWYSFDWPE